MDRRHEHGREARGSSRIELILGDCVVQENWTSAGNTGYSGKSHNIYNVALQRWEQYWVDNAGGNIFFYGGLKDGIMDYWTDELPQPDGKKLKRHLQFLKLGPDTVRQFERQWQHLVRGVRLHLQPEKLGFPGSASLGQVEIESVDIR